MLSAHSLHTHHTCTHTSNTHLHARKTALSAALTLVLDPTPPCCCPQAYSVAFDGVAWHPAAKCAVVTPILVASTWVAGMLLRCIPGVKRVL